MDREFWEANAESWRANIQGQPPESRLATGPAILTEIRRHRPARVLDLGCGEGWLGPALAAAGIEYLGVDFSPALIEIARRTHPLPAPGRFAVAAYTESDLRTVAAVPYDVVVFNFSLFARDLRPALDAGAACLAPGGALLVQTLHPCFALQPYENGERSEDFRAFPVPFRGEMRWYGRTLGTWVADLSAAGWMIEACAEPRHPTSGDPCSILFTLRRSARGD